MENGQAPSIFNDVIGPIMRGPSSSHVAGAARIGSLVRQAAGEKPKRVVVDFDSNGSLAESHEGHGTDMGFACGILDIPLTDERVDDYRRLIVEEGIDLEYRILDYGVKHPNFYRISVEAGNGDRFSMDAISTGGGMIELVALDGLAVSVLGDYFESCYFICAERKEGIVEEELRREIPSWQFLSVSEDGTRAMVNIKTSEALTETEKAFLEKMLGPERFYFFEPILPTRSSADCRVPFCTAAELLEFNRGKKRELWELAAFYESVRGNTTEEQVFTQMEELAGLMSRAVDTGLKGTSYEDRILHSQARLLGETAETGRLVPGSVMNEVIQCITAIMETKSSMGVIVAAPTAGSCGCLPGTLLGLERALGLERRETVKGLLAAGLIGVFFAEGATFAAEVGGCQMECGAGSGMAAGGVAQMMGAPAEVCIDAASVALQGLTGLACDPVANRVEVPCLNKNIVGGMNALSSTNMVLSGFDRVIPLDETIAAMYDIGLKLPLELRCTFGGLGKTKTSLELRKRLEEKQGRGKKEYALPE